jgi:hypothetical protein
LSTNLQTPEVGRLVDQLDGPRHVLAAGDQPLPFQGLEVADDAVRGADLEGLADFTDGRAVAAGMDLVANETVNLELPFRRRVALVFVGGDLQVERVPRKRGRRGATLGASGGGASGGA